MEKRNCKERTKKNIYNITSIVKLVAVYGVLYVWEITQNNEKIKNKEGMKQRITDIVEEGGLLWYGHVRQ